ncbi:MAG: hypothetical protein AAF572_00770 [Cyanobacteria bacterium P01_B01_bin.77]
MPTIKIVLDSIVCYDTEDVTGADDVYLIGGVRVSKGNFRKSKAFVTPNPPLRINDDQPRHIPIKEKIFEAQVQPGSDLELGMYLYEQDSSADVEKLQKLEDYLDRGLAISRPSKSVLNLSLSAIQTALVFDDDDQLGRESRFIEINTLPRGWKRYVAKNFYEGGIGYSTWRYKLYYRIGKF